MTDYLENARKAREARSLLKDVKVMGGTPFNALSTTDDALVLCRQAAGLLSIMQRADDLGVYVGDEHALGGIEWLLQLMAFILEAQEGAV